MTPSEFALRFLFLFVLKIALMGQQGFSSVPKDWCFFSVKAGENVMLQCSHDPDAAAKFHWYKLTLGQKPKLICTVYKYNSNGTFHNRFKNNPRFTLDNKEEKNRLKITNVHILDSATYYCITGNAFKIEFDFGTIIHVQESGENIQTLVQQIKAETIQAEGSITLNCVVFTAQLRVKNNDHTWSCNGEHRVHWFKHSEEYHPKLIYTHRGSNDHCEGNPEEKTNYCEYNLPLKNLDESHTGTYYCAVASYGQILFGNGINLDLKANVDSVYLLRGPLVVTTSLSILQAFLLFLLYKRKRCKDQDSQSRRSSPSTTAGKGDQSEENLHYAALKTRRLTNQKLNRSESQRNVKTDCVYSVT